MDLRWVSKIMKFSLFKLLFPLCFMPRNPTMALKLIEKGFNSFVCFTSFRFISMYVIYSVLMLIYVYICMILNIWYSWELYDHMMIYIYTDIYMIYVCSYYENRLRYVRILNRMWRIFWNLGLVSDFRKWIW